MAKRKPQTDETTTRRTVPLPTVASEPPPKPNETCQTCIAFVKCECRYLPPQVISTPIGLVAKWPTVFATDWCLRYVPIDGDPQ